MGLAELAVLLLVYFTLVLPVPPPFFGLAQRNGVEPQRKTRRGHADIHGGALGAGREARPGCTGPGKPLTGAAPSTARSAWHPTGGGGPDRGGKGREGAAAPSPMKYRRPPKGQARAGRGRRSSGPAPPKARRAPDRREWGPEYWSEAQPSGGRGARREKQASRRPERPLGAEGGAAQRAAEAKTGGKRRQKAADAALFCREGGTFFRG